MADASCSRQLAADKSTPNLYWQRADGTGEAQRLTESTNAQEPGIVASERQVPGVRGERLQADDPADGGRRRVGLEAGHALTRFRTVLSRRPSRCSRRTGDGSRTCRTSRGPLKCTCGRSPGRAASGRSRPAAALSRPGRAPGTNCSTAANGQIMVAAFTADGDTFRAEKPRLWSEARYQTRGAAPHVRPASRRTSGSRWRRAAQTPIGAKLDKVVFIFNFFDELRRLAPAKYGSGDVTTPAQVQPHADHRATRIHEHRGLTEIRR